MNSKPLAYDAYQELAHHYAAMIDRKPHNAYYDRPAMLKHWPDLKGLQCLDAGCGPGEYTGLLLERGAKVIAVDVSDKMIEIARARHGQRAEFRIMDLSAEHLDFESAKFHFINAALCFDYIQDWDSLLENAIAFLNRKASFKSPAAILPLMPSTTKPTTIFRSSKCNAPGKVSAK